MASTNKTTNYQLSQFVETDRPAWLTDYNGDMRTIDSNLKEVSDIAGGASGSISALADRMSTAEGNITTNTNDIAALDARADALEAGAQSQAGTIANIQTEQITQNAGIEAATELGYNLARPYDSASTYAVGAYVLFQNTLYKCITAIATGEAFDPTKWLAIKATDEIAGGYTLPIASASQLGGVKVGDGLSIDPVTGILSIGGELIHINYNDVNKPQKLFTIRTTPSNLTYVPLSGYTSSSSYLNITNAAYGSTKLDLYIKDDLYILKMDTSINFDARTWPGACFMIGSLYLNTNPNSEMYQYFTQLDHGTTLENDNLYDGAYISSQNTGGFNGDHSQYTYYDTPHLYFYTGTTANFKSYHFYSLKIGKYGSQT